MKIAILTGASRGLGAKILDLLSEEGWKVNVISRKEMDPVPAGTDVFVEDLNNVGQLDNIMDAIFADIDMEAVSQIALINNAGMIQPIREMGKMTAGEIQLSMNVNVVAPMVLSSAFIREVAGYESKAKIFTVSSGAGKRPFSGWGPYCTAKAGEDMMTRSIGLEQGEEGVRAISFGPGIMDTGMQAEIRSSSKEDFADLERFIGFKEEGALRKPEDVAAVVVQLLNDPAMKQGGIVDVRDFD